MSAEWTGDKPLRKAFEGWTTSRGYAPANEHVSFTAGWDAAIKALTHPRTFDDLKALLPDAAIEAVGERQELVIYTGLTEVDDTLIEMIEEDS